MSVFRRTLKGSALITIGELVGQGCSLTRNIILARALTKADFGIAALLGMIVMTFEIGGRLSIEYCIIQSERGKDPRFLASAHLLQVLLGIASGALIIAFSASIAHFFKVPDAAWALRILALIPVLRSLSHLDIHRTTRRLEFRPAVLTDLIPQLVITLAAWPMTHYWGTYAVLVWLLLAKQLASTIASHFLAEDQYRWAWDATFIKTILSFGWPMLVNGFLLLAIMQGDRFAIGLNFSASELGVYAIASSVALLPSAMLIKLSTTILLPVLATAQKDHQQFLHRITVSSAILAAFSSCYGLFMIVGGGATVVLIFGSKYNEAALLIGWLSLAQAIRLLRNLPIIAAMSKGDSKNSMYSNLLRVLGLGFAFIVALRGGGLSEIAICGAIGECIALLGSLGRLSRFHAVSFKAYYIPFISSILLIGFSILAPTNLFADNELAIEALCAACLAGVTMIGYLLSFRDIRTLLWSRIPGIR